MSDLFKYVFFCRKKMLSALTILMVGCAPQLYWAKSDARPGEFEEDVKQCRQAILSDTGDKGISATLSQVFHLSEDAVGQCLMAKGWFLAEKP